MSFVSFFSEEHLQKFLRPALDQTLAEAIEKQNWDLASVVLGGLIDTWPLRWSIPYAWKEWQQDCDPISLAILSRANEIIDLLGVNRLEIPIPEELPAHLQMKGEELAMRRHEVCGLALKGEIVGVQFSTPLPTDPMTQLAFGELCMEAKSQHAINQYGLPGLFAANAPQWADVLVRAPAGQMGEKLQVSCDNVVMFPSTPARLRKGVLQDTAWLLWNGPVQPLPIHTVGVVLLQNISKGKEAACAAAGLSAEQGNEILTALVAIGALDAIS